MKGTVERLTKELADRGKEITALRGEVERLKHYAHEYGLVQERLLGRYKNAPGVLSTLNEMDRELRRYRDAVEWACGVLERSHDNPYMQPDIVADELRRRAGEG